MAAMSSTSSIGLDGDSSSTIAAGRDSAVRQASISVPSTNSNAMPYRGSRVETIQWHDPNSARDATTRSPVFKWLSIAA